MASQLARYQVIVRGGGISAVWELERRLRDRGFEPVRHFDPTRRELGYAIHFDAPAGVDLDFLRPDFLPPL